MKLTVAALFLAACVAFAIGQAQTATPPASSAPAAAAQAPRTGEGPSHGCPSHAAAAPSAKTTLWAPSRPCPPISLTTSPRPIR